MARRLVFLLLLFLTLLLTSPSHAQQEYADCDSCIEAGYGWSHMLQRCGNFANKDCDFHEYAYDDEDDEDDDYESDEDDVVVIDNEQDDERITRWEDTPITTTIWQTISSNNIEQLRAYMNVDKNVVRYRAKDGRGALHWAAEFGHPDMYQMLKDAGAEETADRSGKHPLDLAEDPEVFEDMIMHSDL